MQGERAATAQGDDETRCVHAMSCIYSSAHWTAWNVPGISCARFGNFSFRADRLPPPIIDKKMRRCTISAALLLLAIGVPLASGVELEKAAGDAVSFLEKNGVDTVEKRAVVGGVLGLVGGMVLKKTQDTLITCGVLGGAIIGGACYVGWVTPEQVRRRDIAHNQSHAFRLLTLTRL